MKTYIIDIFNKIQDFSAKLDNLSTLTDQHWISIENNSSDKVIYIFRLNSELLISTNGNVEKAKWEYLGNHSLLIEISNKNILLRHSFVDENILALKVDSSDEVAVFVNENMFNKELNTIDKIIQFLENKYLISYGNPILQIKHLKAENNDKSIYSVIIKFIFKFIIVFILIIFLLWFFGFISYSTFS